MSQQELKERIVGPWIGGRPIVVDDRRWISDKTRLTIYEGPEVAADERGLGRGWSTVTRSGEDVTAGVLEAANAVTPVAELKRKLLEAAPLMLSEAVGLGGTTGRASERLAFAEQAVWELLHEKGLVVVSDGAVIPTEQWQPLLLEWANWSDPRTALELREPDR